MIVRVLLIACLALGGLTACNKTWAPVEDRSSARGAFMTASDGTYRVRRGDSLHAIAFNFGLDWRQIARWNGIEAPYVIYPDQVLRLGPAAEASRSVTTTAAVVSSSSSPRSSPSSRYSSATRRAFSTKGLLLRLDVVASSSWTAVSRPSARHWYRHAASNCGDATVIRVTTRLLWADAVVVVVQRHSQ